jgi:hypothetical protein
MILELSGKNQDCTTGTADSGSAVLPAQRPTCPCPNQEWALPRAPREATLRLLVRWAVLSSTGWRRSLPPKPNFGQRRNANPRFARCTSKWTNRRCATGEYCIVRFPTLPEREADGP